MLIRAIDRNTFDVFPDVGYNNWSRVRKHHWGMKVIQGERQPKEVLNAVEQLIIEYPEGSVRNVDV